MKTTFIRALAIAMLATSMSAFAVAKDSKPTDAAGPCASAKPETQSSSESKKDRKSQQKGKNDRKDKDDQFLGIWG